jgi:stearoyl-CoA desaturase (delta-9 desaturase)
MSTKPETSRPRAPDTKKVHIADTAITSKNWHKHVNWLNVAFIIGIPIYGCIQALWVPLQFKTAVWAVIYYFFTGMGITAGKFFFFLFLWHHQRMVRKK